MTMLETARSYVAAGLSVLPIKPGGAKSPAVEAWKPYQQRVPTDGELVDWFGGERVGIAVIGGAVSAGLEVIDFDSLEAWNAWRAEAIPLLRDAGLTLPKMPVAATGGGGRHLYLRHEGEQQGNTKLARWCVGGKAKTVIETRGAGGYALVPPTPASCHPEGRPYVMLQGSLTAIPVLSAEQRGILWDVARSLTQVASEETVTPRPRAANGTRPGDLYCQSAEWDALLRRHGWHKVRQSGEVGYWRRPGKKQGISASTNHDGTGYLYVWSSNAPPFEPERGYSLFGALGLLDYGGDYRAAADHLASIGYAAPEKPRVPDRARERAGGDMATLLARRCGMATR